MIMLASLDRARKYERVEASPVTFVNDNSPAGALRCRAANSAIAGGKFVSVIEVIRLSITAFFGLYLLDF
jgi:hypothetical protein